MNFNADIHCRRSIRLRDYDYSRAGAYFVTICTFERECLFGDVVDGVMRLSCEGISVAECWQAIPIHFQCVELDEFVIMPNHVHGIIFINDENPPVGATHASPDCGLTDFITGARHATTRATHASPLRESGPQRQSIGAIVGSFKSAATKRINPLRNNPGGAVWQRNYYERVIRSDRELDNIRQYIADNPAHWAEDENHPVVFDP